ncbi:hypothetical protein [Lentibacillus sp. Marseille-P4043]|uniref:hypothetical protein n=1 Tax=Lentibacillus sp. Marseille-P4043 TaxID=2040293 RepID=UPI000D0B35AB|nr:hypothetical protein [Lentibacillus sp. Marseille-P4043]
MNRNDDERLLTDLKSMQGENLLVVTQAVQLNLLGQVFRPVFSGKIKDVQESHITLSPVIIKMVNAPFYEFPFPLSIPLENVVAFSTEIPPDLNFPLT